LTFRSVSTLHAQCFPVSVLLQTFVVVSSFRVAEYVAVVGLGLLFRDLLLS
jgi:hypothetical protein